MYTVHSMNHPTETYSYTVIIRPEQPSGYYAVVPSLPGCVSQGETVDETLAMIKDAISGYIEVLDDEKLPIPNDKPPIISEVTLQHRSAV